MKRWAWLLLIVGCDCGGGTGDTCMVLSDCPMGQVCVDNRCQDRPMEDGGVDSTIDAPTGDAPECPSGLCAGVCCAEGEFCSANICIADFGPCTTNDDCSDDSYCMDGRCLPFGEPGPISDDECNRVIVAGVFTPTVQCEFRETPEGDAFPAHLHVLSTPMVVDFLVGRGPDDPPEPSIVAVFDDGVDGSSELPTGVIRILDGATCTQQAELGSLQLTSHSSPPALGDINGDGRPEIIAFQGGGGLVAFTYSDVAGAWEVLWRSTARDGVTPFNPVGSGWSGPSIYDLDDDGVPEILRSGYVFDSNGILLDDSLGNLPGGSTTGVFAVVADVDEDGRAEHVQGHGVWEWDSGASTWVAEAYSTGGSVAGHTALADFGAFAGTADWPATAPEVAVVSAGFIRVQTLDGSTVFGPVAIPGGGQGGPPTIADFDNDGVPEVATAGASQYVVVDFDCTATPIGGTCASGRTDGILWAQPSQDQSSNRTGSSVFDFEGDGRAEVVYGDECFVRVYDGETGDVVFSQSRSSCTWYENPIIADLDGDFNAEIVIGDNFNCPNDPSGTGRDCSAFLDVGNTDPLFAGLRCSENTDCVSGSCDEGFCRCTDDTQCCAGIGCDRAAFVCLAPPAGTPGTGNTCRASRPRGTLGIRVYRDAADRWVGSRRVWNQHAYHVTNVNEDGTIPATSATATNWTDPTLNNFRQNVQGEGRPDDAPDLTSRATPVVCGDDGAELTTLVCNRGTEPVGAGLPVGFYEGEPSDATLLCRAMSTVVLNPGECENVSCLWADPPTERPGIDVTVVADDLAENTECHEGNNRSTLEGVVCGVII